MSILPEAALFIPGRTAPKWIALLGRGGRAFVCAAWGLSRLAEECLRATGIISGNLAGLGISCFTVTGAFVTLSLSSVSKLSSSSEVFSVARSRLLGMLVVVLLMGLLVSLKSSSISSSWSFSESPDKAQSRQNTGCCNMKMIQFQLHTSKVTVMLK